jgi:hypothetical protein
MEKILFSEGLECEVDTLLCLALRHRIHGTLSLHLLYTYMMWCLGMGPFTGFLVDIVNLCFFKRVKLII